MTCFAVRLIRLGHLSFWMDEGFPRLAAQEILNYGYPLYPSGHIYFKGIFYSYLLSFFSLFFGLSEFSMRLFTLLASVITLPVLYIIAKKFFNELVGVFAVLITAFSVWQTEYGRVAGYYPLLQLFYLLGLYFFYLGYFEGKKKYKYWAVVILMLSPLIHQIGFILIFVYFFYLLMKGWKAFFKKDCLLSFALVSLWYLLLELNEMFFWKVGYVYTPSDSGISGMLSEYFTSFNFEYFREIKIAFPHMYVIVALSFIILVGLFLTTRDPVKKEPLKKWLYIFFSFVIPLAFTGIIKSHLQPRYVFFLVPVLFLLFCYGVYKLAEVAVHFVLTLVRAVFKRDLSALKSVSVFLAFLLVLVLTVDDISIAKIRKIVTRDYRDRIETSLVTRTGRVTHPDHRSPGEFVKSFVQDDDIVIAINMVFQYIYVGKVDYWLWTGGPGTWDGWEETEDGWKDVYVGSSWINNLADLQKVLEEHREDRVWLITSPDTRRRDHIDAQVADFLSENSLRIVYFGRDGYSNVYLWSHRPEDDWTRSPGMEAEWFFPSLGRIVQDSGASQHRAVFLKAHRNHEITGSFGTEEEFEPGVYKLILRAKADVFQSPDILFQAAVDYKNGEQRILLKSIAGSAFEDPNYKIFEYQFGLSRERMLEIKIRFLGTGDLWLDYVALERMDETGIPGQDVS